MRIFVIPLGDNNTASSRLRVHLIAPFLGYLFDLPERYEKGDVLIIQKVHNPDELRKAKSQGAKIIFDCDDPLFYRRAYAGMAQMADVVTVDTESRKTYAEQYTNTPIVVIPDTLDWDGITRKEELKNDIAGWTGYGNNAEFLEGIKIPFKLRLITTPNAKEYFTGEFEQVDWKLETVDEEIRKCEIMINYLPLNETTAQKGMHKLLKSWANGVACYVSRLPDYVKAMEEAGVGEKYLVDDWSKLKNIGFDKKCFDYAMRYKPEIIVKQWEKLFKF